MDDIELGYQLEKSANDAEAQGRPDRAAELRAASAELLYFPPPAAPAAPLCAAHVVVTMVPAPAIPYDKLQAALDELRWLSSCVANTVELARGETNLIDRAPGRTQEMLLFSESVAEVADAAAMLDDMIGYANHHFRKLRAAAPQDPEAGGGALRAPSRKVKLMTGFFEELEAFGLSALAGLASSPATAPTIDASEPALQAAAGAALVAGSALAKAFPTVQALAEFGLPLVQAFAQAHAPSPAPAT